MSIAWLDAAKKDLTLHEIAGPRMNARIRDMFLSCGHPEVVSDEISWCAAATGAWLREAGKPTSQPVSLNLTGKSYEDYGTKCAPKEGAICTSTYTRLGKKDWRRHVGIIVTDPKPGAKSYKVIGGNQADSVSVINVPVKKVTAVRWPPKVLEDAGEIPELIGNDAPFITVDVDTDDEAVFEFIPDSELTDEALEDEEPRILPYRPEPGAFGTCLRETLHWEGLWSNDPYDKGGATMKGVTQRRYDGYRKSKDKATRSVRHITDPELKEIYRVYYWDEVRGGVLPRGLDMAVFDFGVNSGPSRAIRYLQRALGVAEDGHVGPITIEALREAEVSGDVEKKIKTVCDGRLKFVRSLKNFWRFGKGWERRIAGIRAASLDRAGAEEEPVGVAIPLSDPDTQSASQGRAEETKPKVNAKVAGGSGAALAGAASAAATATIPEAPGQAVTALTGWQQFASVVQSTLTMAMEHWPFVLAAGGAYVVIIYGLPILYRRTRP